MSERSDGHDDFWSGQRNGIIVHSGGLPNECSFQICRDKSRGL